ncbi:hypothetical protein EJB05_51120, partial [Eragrostis curvula]
MPPDLVVLILKPSLLLKIRTREDLKIFDSVLFFSLLLLELDSITWLDAIQIQSPVNEPKSCPVFSLVKNSKTPVSVLFEEWNSSGRMWPKLMFCNIIVVSGPIPAGRKNVAKVRTDVMKEKLEKFAHKQKDDVPFIGACFDCVQNA